MGFTPGQSNGVTQRVTKQGEPRENEKCHVYTWLYGLYVVLWVMWVICGYYPQSYIYIYVYVFPQSLFKHSVVHFQDIDR